MAQSSSGFSIQEPPITLEFSARRLTSEQVPPATFAFKTREGGLGLLQITGFTASPRGVKIRYKMDAQQQPVAPDLPMP